MFHAAIMDDPVIQARTKGVGVLTPEDIRNYCAVGPLARASGVNIDIRRDAPYAAYGIWLTGKCRLTKAVIFSPKPS